MGEALDHRLEHAGGETHDETVDRPEGADEEQRARRDAREGQRDGQDGAEEEQHARGDPHEPERLVRRTVGAFECALQQVVQRIGEAQARKVGPGPVTIKQSPIDFR